MSDGHTPLSLEDAIVTAAEHGRKMERAALHAEIMDILNLYSHRHFQGDGLVIELKGLAARLAPAAGKPETAP